MRSNSDLVTRHEQHLDVSNFLMHFHDANHWFRFFLAQSHDDFFMGKKSHLLFSFQSNFAAWIYSPVNGSHVYENRESNLMHSFPSLLTRHNTTESKSWVLLLPSPPSLSIPFRRNIFAGRDRLFSRGSWANAGARFASRRVAEKMSALALPTLPSKVFHDGKQNIGVSWK